MMPPPPPRRAYRLPPPPPKRIETHPDGWTQPPPEPDIPPISPDLSRFDLEYAIWVHGGYPQIPWPEAVKVVLKKCRGTSLGQICAAAINILDKRLPTAPDLTASRFDIHANTDSTDILNQPIRSIIK